MPISRSLPFVLSSAVALAAFVACSNHRDDGGGQARSTSAEVPVPAATHKPSIRVADPARGKTLVAKNECSRCHEGTGFEKATQEKACVGCHEDIIAANFKAPPHIIKEWQSKLVDLRSAPTLERVATSFKEDWVAKFIEEPYDVRPHMRSTMPRLPITHDDAADIAAYLVRTKPPAATFGSLDKGRALYEEKKCSGCHVMSGASVGEPKGFAMAATNPKAPSLEIELAPDLRHTRDRLTDSGLLTFLTKPKESGAKIEHPALSEPEAKDVAAFIVKSELASVPVKARPPRLPVLDRPVSYDEIEKKVLRVTCWHCHAEPDLARGDGGPGMTGGFGFSPKSLNLSTFEGVSAGVIGASGERESVMSSRGGVEAKLLAVLFARQDEEEGKHGPIRGMPLGLPSLTPEEIQLVETWLAQGHPR